MVRQEFERIIAELSTFLERPKPPAKASVDLWYEDVQKIPSACLSYLRQRVKETESWPRNFPGFLWALYRQWLAENPDKKAREEPPGCLYCHEGFLTVSRWDDRHQDWVNYVYRCGFCNVQGPKGIPIQNRTQLIENGYYAPTWQIRHDYHKAFPSPLDELPRQHPVMVTWRIGKATADEALADEIRGILKQ